MQTRILSITTCTLLAGSALALAPFVSTQLQIGSDLNSAQNPFVQPQDDALSGGGRDQSQQFGDVMRGTPGRDVMIGRLGTDVIMGENGNDTIVGGTEHFNPFNRDRAFGGPDQDVFLWSPGDGSDFFDGGPGLDAIVFGLMGEIVDGQLVFQVTNDQQAGEVWINPATGIPLMDLDNSPGFCRVVDASSSPEAADELEALDIDHLGQFFIRGVADSFENGTQQDDNGLRVSISLRDVEVLVCTNREGTGIEAFNLTVSPPQQVSLAWAAQRIPQLGYVIK